MYGSMPMFIKRLIVDGSSNVILRNPDAARDALAAEAAAAAGRNNR